MDMRTKFEFIIEGNEFSTECETWQEALAFFMSSMNESGFSIDEKRSLAINELARRGQVTI